MVKRGGRCLSGSMPKDLERLRRMAEELGDPSARRALERERLRRVYVRTDAILHTIAMVEQSVERKAPDTLPHWQLERIRRHVRAGELTDAHRVALDAMCQIETCYAEQRQLLGVFGCGT